MNDVFQGEVATIGKRTSNRLHLIPCRCDVSSNQHREFFSYVRIVEFKLRNDIVDAIIPIQFTLVNQDSECSRSEGFEFDAIPTRVSLCMAA